MNDGGPAFPFMCTIEGWTCENTGMSLRDWFAGMALCGELAFSAPGTRTTLGPDEIKDISELTYKFADAMLVERQKEVI
jgi:hypothetical protein